MATLLEPPTDDMLSSSNGDQILAHGCTHMEMGGECQEQLLQLHKAKIMGHIQGNDGMHPEHLIIPITFRAKRGWLRIHFTKLRNAKLGRPRGQRLDT